MGTLLFKDNKFIWKGTFEEREIPKKAGFLWDPDAKVWWTKYPEKAFVLLQYADNGAREALERWKKEREEMLEASRAASADVELPAPAGRQYLPFQKAGIAYVLRRFNAGQKGVLLGDEMGLGKTIQALGIINARADFKRVLIICPASLRLNWAREAERWLVRKTAAQVLNGGSLDWTLDEGVWIVNYDRLKEVPENVTFDFIIFDEAHYIKNEKAQRSKYASALAKKARHVLLLTGTPIANRPIELWHPLTLMGAEKQFGGFWNYAKRYCGAYHNGYGWDFRGAANLEELQVRLRERWMVRRLKKEVLQELPPKIRQIIPLPSTTTLKKLTEQEQQLRSVIERYDELLARAREAEVLEDEESFRYALEELESVKASFTEASRIRREIGIAKVDLVAAHIKDILEEENKIVVFAHHKEVVDVLQKSLSEYNPVVITGETSMQNRQSAVDAFQQNPDVRVFIGTLGAASTGLTLTAARVAVFAEIDWVPATLQQAEDRIHRIGQQDVALIQYLVIEGTLEAYIAEQIAKKMDIIDRALNQQVDSSIATIELQTPVAPIANVQVRRLPRLEIYDEKIHELARQALREIASMDRDRASLRNMEGFSKIDVRAGHALASLEKYTPAQAGYALRLAYKYRRQLPDDLEDQIKNIWLETTKEAK